MEDRCATIKVLKYKLRFVITMLQVKCKTSQQRGI